MQPEGKKGSRFMMQRNQPERRKMNQISKLVAGEASDIQSTKGLHSKPSSQINLKNMNESHVFDSILTN